MIPLAPLWALGVQELIGVVLVILFVVSAALQMLARKNQPQRPGGGRPPGRPAGGEVEDEIGEFLRRAAERGRPRQPPPLPKPRIAPPPAMAQVVGQHPVEAEVVRERALGNKLREQVGDYLDSGGFVRRASELGEEVAQADDLLEQRLEEKFDHEVSRLAGVPGESADAPGVAEAEQAEDRVAEFPPTAAAGLPVLLSTAENIRQAIIINEILNRPEDRWT